MATLPGLAERLSVICDVKDGFDESVVRLNDAKVLAWLQRKTEALQRHLQAPPSAHLRLPLASPRLLRPEPGKWHGRGGRCDRLLGTTLSVR